MIERLLQIETPEDAIAFGSLLVSPSKRSSLQRDLCSQGYCFQLEDYWTQEHLAQQGASSFEIFIQEVKCEESTLQVLHRLQLVSGYCPAVSRAIEQLLKKCTI